MYLWVLLRRSKVEEQNRMSARNEVNHLTFNQDYTCVAIGSRNGFSIYNLDPIQLRYNNIGEGIGKIEMLYCTSLLALVGSGEQPGSSPRKFRLWNSQNKEIICEITFASTILKMLMNRERLIVRLEGQIHVYDLATMKCLQVLTIAPSPSGVVALSAESSSYLAFPSGNAGGVVIYDCLTLRLVTQIDAHKNSIAALEFNRAGTLLSTASSTGTVVRLFSIPTGSHLATYRRGSRPAELYSLAFSSDSHFLSAASSTGTVHIFDVVSSIAATTTTPHVSLPASSPPSSSSSNGGGATGSAISSPPPLSQEPYSKGSSNRSRSHSSEKDPSPPSTGTGWSESMASSAYTYLSLAQSWGVGAVTRLNVLPEQLQEMAQSTRAIAVARLPMTDVGSFRAAFITCSSSPTLSTSDDANPPPTDATATSRDSATERKALHSEKTDKLVIITQNKQLFRFSLPQNIVELSAILKTGEDKTIFQCPLEDEASLE